VKDLSLTFDKFALLQARSRRSRPIQSRLDVSITASMASVFVTGLNFYCRYVDRLKQALKKIAHTLNGKEMYLVSRIEAYGNVWWHVRYGGLIVHNHEEIADLLDSIAEDLQP